MCLPFIFGVLQMLVENESKSYGLHFFFFAYYDVFRIGSIRQFSYTDLNTYDDFGQ